MNYEKKYKDALERAKIELNADTTQGTKNVLMTVFPELKDSEDEQIRKGLIKALGSIGKRNWGGIDVFESIAWLEEQDEKKPIMNVPTREVILSIWDLGNEWKELTNGSISTEYGTQLDYIQKHWHESEYYLREKQGEQKVPINDFKAKNWYVSEVNGNIHDMTYNPTDKVEPKFKVGDWIVNNEDGSIGQIKKIVYDESGYGYDHTNGWFHSVFEKDYHLWTIDDAKDGDVLVDSLSGDNQITILFKCIGLDTFIRAYCGWNHYNFRVTTDGIGYGTLSSTKYIPATKEQRNLLFQKMKKAGYWWDVDKKELKLLISNGSDFESDDSEQESKEEIKTTAYGTFGNNGAIEYVYILDYCSGRVIVAKHDTEESIETLFDRLGLKESQCQYMVSTDILSIEYINF